ncbi:hypothetical protein CPC08DRAFT_755859 [Agrocybe pediades]|nr:hypothetical protein CPC08DRAFT_755859 [Agrocybe pediades]
MKDVKGVQIVNISNTHLSNKFIFDGLQLPIIIAVTVSEPSGREDVLQHLIGINPVGLTMEYGVGPLILAAVQYSIGEACWILVIIKNVQGVESHNIAPPVGNVRGGKWVAIGKIKIVTLLLSAPAQCTHVRDCIAFASECIEWTASASAASEACDLPSARISINIHASGQAFHAKNLYLNPWVTLLQFQFQALERIGTKRRRNRTRTSSTTTARNGAAETLSSLLFASRRPHGRMSKWPSSLNELLQALGTEKDINDDLINCREE